MHKPFSPRKLSELILQHLGSPETGARPAMTPNATLAPGINTPAIPLDAEPTSGAASDG